VFLSLEGDRVWLRLGDGRKSSIKYNALSARDRTFIDDLQKNAPPHSPSSTQGLAQQKPNSLQSTGLTESEQQVANLLGKQVERALATDIDQVIQLFDVPYFSQQTIEGLALPAEGATALQNKASANLKQVVSQVLDNSKRGFGPLTFVSGRRVGTSKRLLFRSTQKDSGIPAYWEFIYEKSVAGKTPLKDMWDFRCGERLSQMLRRGNAMTAAGIMPDFRSDLVPGGEDWNKNKDDISRMYALAAQGNLLDAIAVLKTLPSSIRNDKSLLNMYTVWADQSKSESDMRDAIMGYALHFPDDPTLAFIRLSTIYSGADRVQFMKTVDLIEKAVGGDPYLDEFRRLWLAGNADSPAKQE